MFRFVAAFALAAVCACAGVCLGRSLPAAEAPGFAAVIAAPGDYREWIFLSSGMDMSYAAPPVAGVATGTPAKAHESVFDNVFVQAAAYRSFLRLGTWPDGTVLVLENRAGRQDASINKGGRTQGAEVTGLELHVKKKGQWAFYSRASDGREHLIARPASCYSCHEEHAAADTTFVQFYPTLLPVAALKGTLSPQYMAEENGHAAK